MTALSRLSFLGKWRLSCDPLMLHDLPDNGGNSAITADGRRTYPFDPQTA